MDRMGRTVRAKIVSAQRFAQVAASIISPWCLALLLAWANCAMAQATSVAAPTAVPSSAAFNAADVGAALQNTHVLLVGIEDYGRDSKLAGPARDLCALYQTYVAALELSPSNVTVLLSPGRFGPSSPCAAVPVRAATRPELLAQLRQQASRLDSSEQHLLLFRELCLAFILSALQFVDESCRLIIFIAAIGLHDCVELALHQHLDIKSSENG